MKQCKCGRKVTLDQDQLARIRVFAKAHPCVDQVAIADLIGVSTSRISEILSGRSRVRKGIAQGILALLLISPAAFAQQKIQQQNHMGRPPAAAPLLYPPPYTGPVQVQQVGQPAQQVTVIVVAPPAPPPPPPMATGSILTRQLMGGRDGS